jgi:glucose-6-phosphate-specific signal transduction histidine kinase
MWAAVATLVLGVALCLLYKSDRERHGLMVLAAVAFGLALLSLPELAVYALVLAGWLIKYWRMAAEGLAPIVLLVALAVLLWRLARRWWRQYPTHGPTGRGLVLLLTAALGVMVAALLRATPFLPDAANIAGEGARAGLDAGVEKAIDEAGERLTSDGGGAPP